VTGFGRIRSAPESEVVKVEQRFSPSDWNHAKHVVCRSRGLNL
jgi:hypothetical protein